MKKTFHFVISISILLFNSCTSLRVSYDYDGKIDFRDYKTFSFYKEGLEKLLMNDLDKRRILEGVKNNLESKKILEKNLDPDCYVNISFFTKDKINTYYYDNWPVWGFWYGPMWGGMGTRAYTYQYKEGTIAIDIIDAKKKLLLWQGQGSGINLEDLNSKKEAIEKLINKILKNYPPFLREKH